ncbi:MAG: Rne/Rng family ribonuclease [Candidatus Marinimicrobia bacterium]|nr:Rne/Rng family ribonuclease [Candidatus Neomarinimicrobiota bacterium]
MNKEIFVSETASERRIAILEDKVLVELYVEKPHDQGIVGNIYKGKVENVLPGMQAAFVDIGLDINAFLPFSEISDPEYLKNTSNSEEEDDNNNHKRQTRSQKEIQVDLITGQDILVQVIKEPFSGKGPRVTTNLTLPGHLIVLIPNSHFIGISKKIWDKYEKRRLRKIVKRLVSNNIGLVVRTEAEGKSEKILKKDFEILMKYWKTISKKAKSVDSPTLIYEDLEALPTIFRDLLTSEVVKVVFDSKKLYRRIQNYIQNVSPELASRVTYNGSRQPLFESLGIEKEIEKSIRRRVWLKSGAYLVIEHTEAMVVVDVNSGRFIGKSGHEENSLKINLESAKEIARQLRIRDIGGLIIIDFIDMQVEKNKQKVYYELRKELRKDRAKVAVSPITEFGLLEMTRQRIRISLRDSLSDECPVCAGSGRIRSKDAIISKIDTWLKKFRQKSRELRLKIAVHPSLGEYLRNTKKDAIRKFMWSNFIHIEVIDDELLHPDEFQVFSKKRKIEITDEV